MYGIQNYQLYFYDQVLYFIKLKIKTIFSIKIYQSITSSVICEGVFAVTSCLKHLRQLNITT